MQPVVFAGLLGSFDYAPGPVIPEHESQNGELCVMPNAQFFGAAAGDAT